MSENNGNGSGGVVMILTSQTQDDILSEGKIIIPAQRINFKRVIKRQYVVCCNQLGNGFLVAKISEVISDVGENFITFSEYATISNSGMWRKHGNAKRSFAYLESLRATQIGPLDWEPYDEGHSESDDDTPKPTTSRIVKREDVEIFERINMLRDELAELQAKKREVIHAMIDRLDDTTLDQVLLSIEPLLEG